MAFLTVCILFVFLSFLHFVVDFVFQSQEEASNKAFSAIFRAKHCAIYSFLMGLCIAITCVLVPGFSIKAWELAVCFILLFATHYFIDSYKPIYWWAKYIRRIPEIRNAENGMQAFKELWSKPVYPILFIAVDQILHLSVLWLIAPFML